MEMPVRGATVAYRLGRSDRDRHARALLARAGIMVNGGQPWDMRIHHPDTLDRVLSQGSLGLGESYMDGWWDCEQLDGFFCRVLQARLDEQVGRPGWWWTLLRARLTNLQSLRRAWQVGRVHYDLGNDLYAAMLDPSMAYSCAYWAHAGDLAQAQEAKLELVCRKLALEPGMTLLDIGCGWGSLMLHAARHHRVESKRRRRIGGRTHRARRLPDGRRHATEVGDDARTLHRRGLLHPHQGPQDVLRHPHRLRHRWQTPPVDHEHRRCRRSC